MNAFGFAFRRIRISLTMNTAFLMCAMLLAAQAGQPAQVANELPTQAKAEVPVQLEALPKALEVKQV